MRHGSLFSRIGGIDLGFERAGIETAWECETDPACREVLGEKFGVPIYGDVARWKDWIDEADEIDVLSGGFPCSATPWWCRWPSGSGGDSYSSARSSIRNSWELTERLSG